MIWLNGRAEQQKWDWAERNILGSCWCALLEQMRLCVCLDGKKAGTFCELASCQHSGCQRWRNPWTKCCIMDLTDTWMSMLRSTKRHQQPLTIWDKRQEMFDRHCQEDTLVVSSRSSCRCTSGGGGTVALLQAQKQTNPKTKATWKLWSPTVNKSNLKTMMPYLTSLLIALCPYHFCFQFPFCRNREKGWVLKLQRLGQKRPTLS